jgi:hypothetical protein
MWNPDTLTISPVARALADQILWGTGPDCVRRNGTAR